MDKFPIHWSKARIYCRHQNDGFDFDCMGWVFYIEMIKFESVALDGLLIAALNRQQ